LRDVLEEADLGLIDIAVELDIPGAQPPIVRQFQRKITAGLPRFAPANTPARTCCTAVSARMAPAKETREGGQIIVPVVIARQCEEKAVVPLANSSFPLVSVGKRRAQLGVVAFRGWGRIDFIAAKHQHAALQQKSGRRLALRILRWVQLRSREQPGHRMGGSPAVPSIGAEIKPKISVSGEMRRRGKIKISVEIGSVERIEGGDQLAPIEHLSEDSSLGDSYANCHESPRIIPTGHPLT